jgi:hypothetical protein
VSDRRFYVSLTATCPEAALPNVLAGMQAAMSDLVDDPNGGLDGLSLSFTRDDADNLSGELTSDGALPTALPVAGPVTSTGPGAPPPDAELPPVDPGTYEAQHAAGEQG